VVVGGGGGGQHLGLVHAVQRDEGVGMGHIFVSLICLHGRLHGALPDVDGHRSPLHP